MAENNIATNGKGHPSYRTLHILPGRIRLFLPGLIGARGTIRHYEEAYRKIDGIWNVRGNPITGTLLLIYDPSRVSLSRIIYLLYQLNRIDQNPSSKEKERTFHGHYRKGHTSSLLYQFLGVLGTGIILGFLAFQRILLRLFPVLGRLPVRWLASGTALIAGIPIFKEGLEDMVNNRRLSLDFMVSMAAIIAIFMGEGLVALEVVWLMNCGTLLEDYTEERSRRAIRKLLEIGEEKAWLFKEGALVRVSVEEIEPDNVVVVHGGEKILVDGEVVAGQAAVNQAPVTGESIPVEKVTGDTVYAGTLVDRGTIYIRASKVGDETYLARVLHMVEESLERRAPIESISDRFAAWFVPSAILFSILVLATTRNFYRAFTVLVTACPCAAAIATPTAISAAIGNAARRNMLVKGGIFIEQASKIDTLCLDKTGTVTEGRPKVATVLPAKEGISEDDLLILAASAEMRSTHPLAHALSREAGVRGLKLIEPLSFEVIAGRGVFANLGDHGHVLVGSRRLMESQNIRVSKIDKKADRIERSGESLLYVAVNGEFIGLIGVLDMPRPEAAMVIREVERSGILVYLLTGDHQKTAEAISREVGITRFQYDMLPEDKANFIDRLRQEGRVVAMLGDGVNDALALARSDLGIAMGAGGSDVAVEASDIALKANDLTRILALRDLSLKTMRIIRQNYIYSMGVNTLGIGLGASGIISPLIGGVIHVMNSLGVILNSSRILLIENGEHIDS